MPAGRTAAATACGLVALSFLCFWPSLDGQFLSDDNNAIVANEYVVGPLRPSAIFSRFSWWGATRADAPGYRPLVTLTFALNHAVAGLAPWSYHAVNLILHGLVSWLLYLVAVRLGLPVHTALLAAIAFCVLPVHTEAVAWVVGRAELMAAAGVAITLLCLIAYRRRGDPRALLGALAAFACGLLSKENAVTVLAAPLLLSLTVPAHSRQRHRDAVAAAAMAIGLLMYMGMRAWAGPLLPAASADLLDNPLSVLAPLSRVAGAATVLGRYLVLTFWPDPLTIDYSYDALAIGPGYRGDAYAVLAVGCFVAGALVGWRYRKSQPVVTFGLLLAAATYSIVSNLIVPLGTIMGERLFYLPTFGLCLAAGPGLAWLSRRFEGKGVVILAAVALAYVGVDIGRSLAWRSPVALFEAAVAAYPRSARAHMELGSAYGRAGEEERAAAAFREAIAIMPEYAAAWYNLGNFHARRGRYEEAVAAYEHAVDHAPRLAQAWYNMGLAYRMQRNDAAAADAFGKAAEAAPGDPDARTALADSLLAAGRYREAAEAYTSALELGAPRVVSLINRGVARQRASGCRQALPDYLAALEVEASHPSALANAVGCLRALGRHADAGALAERARVANRHNGR